MDTSIVTDPPARPLKYMPQLDALRAFAVAGVMALHYHQTSRTITLGIFGVRLFFVLSGFLITGILLDCRDLILDGEQSAVATLTRFYVRRFLRIVPVFYLVAGLAWFLKVPAARDGLFWHLGYASNFYIAHVKGWPMGVGHFWSLAVEEQFYLIWPLLICCIPRRRAVAPVIAVIVIAAIFLRILLRTHLSNPWYLDMSPLASMETLGLGSLLAAVSREGSGLQRTVKPLLLVALFAGSVLFFLRYIIKSKNAIFQAIPMELMFGLLGVWIVGYAAQGIPGFIGKILSWRPLRALGAISYGIYLYHNLVPFAVGKCLGYDAISLTWDGVFAIITIIVAAISWRFFERPINAMKVYFPYRVVSRQSVSNAQTSVPTLSTTGPHGGG